MKTINARGANVVFRAIGTMKLGSFTFEDFEPVMKFDTLTVTTQEISATANVLRAGPTNAQEYVNQIDKTVTVTFSDAFMQQKMLAMFAGGDLIEARNPALKGASASAETIRTTVLEESTVDVLNIADTDDPDNWGAPDGSLAGQNARGGLWNLWLKKRPYVGQGRHIFVHLRDKLGNEWGDKSMKVRLAPNAAGFYEGENLSLQNVVTANTANSRASVLSVWKPGDKFIAFDRKGLPMRIMQWPEPVVGSTGYPTLDGATSTRYQNAYFDDHVAYYVVYQENNALRPAIAPSLVPATATYGDILVSEDNGNWNSGWGDLTQAAVEADYVRTISLDAVPSAINQQYSNTVPGYHYLLAKPGSIAEPKCFKEGNEFVYKVNGTVFFYQDLVEFTYATELRHDAQMVRIVPDKFAGMFYVEGFMLEPRKSDGVLLPMTFIIPKFQLTTGITLSYQATGDPAPIEFTGTPLKGYTKYNPTEATFIDTILYEANDNYDKDPSVGDPVTDFRRYNYNEDMEGAYIAGDATLAAHSNVDWSDIPTAGTDYTGDRRPPFTPAQFSNFPNALQELRDGTSDVAPTPIPPSGS